MPNDFIYCVGWHYQILLSQCCLLYDSLLGFFVHLFVYTALTIFYQVPRWFMGPMCGPPGSCGQLLTQVSHESDCLGSCEIMNRLPNVKSWYFMNTCHILLSTALNASDTTWWQRSGSTLAQVMACYLMAQSQYLNQSWIFISEVRWQSPEDNFTTDNSAINYKN